MPTAEITIFPGSNFGAGAAVATGGGAAAGAADEVDGEGPDCAVLSDSPAWPRSPNQAAPPAAMTTAATIAATNGVFGLLAGGGSVTTTPTGIGRASAMTRVTPSSVLPGLGLPAAAGRGGEISVGSLDPALGALAAACNAAANSSAVW